MVILLVHGRHFFLFSRHHIVPLRCVIHIILIVILPTLFVSTSDSSLLLRVILIHLVATHIILLRGHASIGLRHLLHINEVISSKFIIAIADGSSHIVCLTSPSGTSNILLLLLLLILLLIAIVLLELPRTTALKTHLLGSILIVLILLTTARRHALVTLGELFKIV